MARIIEAVEDWLEYIPEFEENRQDPDPVSMELHFMTPDDRAAFSRTLPMQVKKAKDKNHVRIAVERLLAKRVRNVKNYTYLGNKIETGEDLAKRGESELIDEVYDALMKISTLQDGLKKKLTSPSD